MDMIEKRYILPFIHRNIEEIDKLMIKSGKPAHFKLMQANQKIRSKGDHRWPPSNYEPILKNGVWGSRMDLQKEPEVFKNFPELIALFANVLKGGQQIASSRL